MNWVNKWDYNCEKLREEDEDEDEEEYDKDEDYVYQGEESPEYYEEEEYEKYIYADRYEGDLEKTKNEQNDSKGKRFSTIVNIYERQGLNHK